MNTTEINKSKDWTKKMKRKGEINNLLRQLGWDHLVVKKIKTKSKRNMTRRTMIVDAFDWQSKQDKRFIIDVKIGLPCWEQIMDATFYAGADCDIRIVIFDGTKVKEPGCFASYDEDIVRNFTHINNIYGVKTYLLKAQQITGCSNNSMDFNIMAEPVILNSYSPNEHPGLEKFNWAEYWVIYYNRDSVVHYMISGDPNRWFNFQHYEEFNHIGFLAFWEANAFFYEIIAKSQQSIRIVESILTNFIKNDKADTYDPELVCDGQNGEPYRWNLTLFNDSNEDFYKLSSEDKKRVAGYLDFHMLKIRSLFFEDMD
jgi:hypothetical protein